MANQSFTFAAVGQSLIKRDLRKCSNPAFAQVLQTLGGADVAFTNLECTLRGEEGGWPTKSSYLGVAEPVVLDALSAFGFNMLSLSNNHAFDLGSGGILSTLAEIDKRRFCAAGIGRDRADALTPGLLDTDIGRVALVAMDGGPAPDSYRALDATDKAPARPGVNALRINAEIIVSKEELATLRAIEDEIGHRRMQRLFRKKSETDMGTDGLDFYGLRFRAGPSHRKQGIPDEADIALQLAAIKRAKGEARFVVAYLHHHHWDADWADVPDWERDFAKRCVDAGADAYVSHGVPLLQPIEIYKGRPIFYSLGNIIFHSASAEGWFHDHIWQSVVATCRFGADGNLDGIEFDPIVIGGEAALDAKDFSAREAPHRAGNKAAKDILTRLADLSAPIGTAIEIRDGRGYVG